MVQIKGMSKQNALEADLPYSDHRYSLIIHARSHETYARFSANLIYLLHLIL